MGQVCVDCLHVRGLLNLGGWATSLPREEVIIRGVINARLCSSCGLGATGLGRYTARGIHALHARELAERACRTDRLRREQQPGNRAGFRRGGTFRDCARDLAAIVRLQVGPA